MCAEKSYNSNGGGGGIRGKRTWPTPVVLYTLSDPLFTLHLSYGRCLVTDDIQSITVTAVNTSTGLIMKITISIIVSRRREW